LKELDRKDTQKRPGEIVFRMDDMESLGLSKNDVQVRNEWRRITGFNWFTHGVCECVWIHYLHKYCVCFCQPTRLNLQMNCFLIATVAVIVLTDLAYILLWDDCVTCVGETAKREILEETGLYTGIHVTVNFYEQ